MPNAQSRLGLGLVVQRLGVAGSTKAERVVCRRYPTGCGACSIWWKPWG